MYDIVIIGAGIVGSFLAYDLSKYHLKVAVVEKENDVANGASMANSAIIHAGHDPIEGTLKAKLNVQGNKMYEAICKKLDVPYQRCGAFVVATNETERASLLELYQRGQARGIECSLLDASQAHELEPNLADRIVEVLSLPPTAIICPWELSIALMESAMDNQSELFLQQTVKNIEKKDDYFIVTTQKQTFKAKCVINAAGIYSDEIYQMFSNDVLFEVTPKRGEYFVLDHQGKDLVNRVIYPVPSVLGKGVLVVPTVHDNILLGPNSELIQDKTNFETTEAGLAYVKENITKTMKNIPLQHIIRSFAGLRATSSTHDFVIESAKEDSAFINVAGIESPGIASAPAISEYVIEQLVKKVFPLSLKESMISRRPPIQLSKLSNQEKNDLVKQDPRYGRIVCRCEQISEAEIVDCIHRNCGAISVKGVKKRVRPGMGRCQGGFCEPLVVEILARELHISKLDVINDQEDSFILKSISKGEIR